MHALKIYRAPKLCTETTLSKHPVVLPKSSDVHLLRSLWMGLPFFPIGKKQALINERVA